MRFLLSFFAGLLAVGSAVAQPKLPNLPPDLMAPTDPLTPADERKAFTLPPGFDVQLVASEPDIQKPMQMAWDAKGRLWVTTSYHYPFAAEGKPTDKVFVLSDFDPQTGKARSVSTFANDLNIPIGVLPLPDGKSVLVSSVGEIRKYRISETEQGPKADGHEVLFKGFGSKDTHGMYNSYTLMPDGWVYACHGFANDSTVKDRSGNEIKMQSGHTFRFKPDGSKIEVWTRGQVNPFGMTVDPWFNLYTADCHSKPITQLIPGAYYDSFGKPHDGLGYAPHVTAHSHNSTGLCGLVWYDADHFPKDYSGTMFVGNVVTNRINFDRIEWRGASPVAKELPDFLVSKDRWFRPVDIKLGPDGALYVADFYNKIIGHYEVDLKDPRRDKDRGRIWRIVWTGKESKNALPKPYRADFTKATDAELFEDLLHPNLTVRFLAGHQLRHRMAEVRNVLPDSSAAFAKAQNAPESESAFCAWLMFIGEADKNVDKRYADFSSYLRDPKRSERLAGHMIRAFTSRAKWGDDERALLVQLFKAFDSVHQKRAAVEAVAAHPHADFVPAVIEVLKKADKDDTHLRHAAKIALRNCLRDADAWPPYTDVLKLREGFDPLYAEIALAIPTEKAASYLLSQLDVERLPPERFTAAAEHVVRYGAERDWLSVFNDLANEGFRSENPLYGDGLAAAIKALQARGKKLNGETAQVLLTYTNKGLTREVKNPTGAANVRRLTAVFRVLAAVPGATEGGSQLTIPAQTISALEGWVLRSEMPVDLRIVACEVLLGVSPVKSYTTARGLLDDPKLPPDVRERLLAVFASSLSRDARLDARDALKTVPYRTAVPIGLALAGTKAGAEDLLTAVKEGKAPARLLQEKAILERLKASNADDWQKRVNDLTKSIPPADQRIADLLKKRAAGFASAKLDKAEGAKLFAKHCAACHRIGDAGGKIAPQLDGVGVRGVERLLEDILDPNRNVDQAFRARSITLTSDKTLTALMLRVEGKVLVVADLEGKEQRIPLDEIATNRETMLSAMPANFADVIPEADLYQIVGYLLDQKAKP
jgi:putative heme-binding domain-containing protein